MKKLWPGIALLFCFIFAAPIFAQTAFPVGGSSIATAVTLTPGEYLSTREVAADEYEYYKLNVTKGQIIKIKLTTGKEGYANATLWNSEKEEIANGYMLHENDSTTFNTQIPYTGIVYLGIGDDTLPGNTYKISLESNFPTPTDDLSNPNNPGDSGDYPLTTSTPNPKLNTTGSLVTPVVIGLAAVIVIVIVVLVFRSKNGKK